LSYEYNQSNLVAKRQRGGCLTTWLVVVSISQLSTTYTLFQSIANHSLHLPQWYQYALIIGVLISIIGTVGIWLWKKWGVFCYLSAIFLNIVVAVIAGSIIVLPILAIGSIIGLAILYIVLRDKWQYFT
jgi:hypothetical protein